MHKPVLIDAQWFLWAGEDEIIWLHNPIQPEILICEVCDCPKAGRRSYQVVWATWLGHKKVNDKREVVHKFCEKCFERHNKKFKIISQEDLNVIRTFDAMELEKC